MWLRRQRENDSLKEGVRASLVAQLVKEKVGGFPGGSVAKNSPANTGDLGLIPDLGRTHTPQSN